MFVWQNVQCASRLIKETLNYFSQSSEPPLISFFWEVRKSEEKNAGLLKPPVFIKWIYHAWHFYPTHYIDFQETKFLFWEALEIWETGEKMRTGKGKPTFRRKGRIVNGEFPAIQMQVFPSCKTSLLTLAIFSL